MTAENGRLVQENETLSRASRHRDSEQYWLRISWIKRDVEWTEMEGLELMLTTPRPLGD